MRRRLHRFALSVFRRLPTLPRRWVVRTLYPKYTVGAICVIERDDGAVLLLRQHYRRSWGTPGGLLNRGEEPADGVRREVLEETGLHVDLVGEPAVQVDAPAQRVDLIYRGTPRPGEELDSLRPTSPEIDELRWFTPSELPELQFETAGALVALARSSAAPQARPLA